MPLASNSKIGVNGVILGSPSTVGTLPRVVSLGPPPVIADSIARQFTDGAVEVLTVGAVDVDAGLGATETFRLSGGFISEGAGNGSFIGGRGAAAAGADAIAIGRGATASVVDNIAIGRGASATGGPSIAIGAGVSAPASSNIVLGGSVTNASAAIVIGFSASAQSNGGSPTLLAIGNNSIAGSTTTGAAVGMAIGQAAVARRNDLIIGHGSTSTANTADNNNLYIGHGVNGNTSAGGNTAIGNFIQITGGGTFNLLIGRSSSTSGSQNIALGGNVIGALSNHAFIGAPSIDVRTFILGAGDTGAAPAARTLRFTNGTGTNIAAGNITIVAPRSTGNAASAQFIVQVGVVGASGAALQAARDALSATFTNTAGETALSVYDVDSAAMMRVLVGAAGTGPGGVGRALYLA